MENFRGDIVNKILIDINEEYKKKIKELEDKLKKSQSSIDCIQCELDEAMDFVVNSGGICCEQCSIWGMQDVITWCAEREEHLCEECRS